MIPILSIAATVFLGLFVRLLFEVWKDDGGHLTKRDYILLALTGVGGVLLACSAFSLGLDTSILGHEQEVKGTAAR